MQRKPRGGGQFGLQGGVQGRAAATGLALAVVAGCALAACSADLSGASEGGEGASGGGASGPAQQGRYSALPEPCGTLDGEVLRELLPGGASEEYAGEPAVTYDTGRRVGCAWTVPSRDGNRALEIDFERIVSYDPEVSDDDQAALDFALRAEEAGVALPDAEDGDAGDAEEADETEEAAGGLNTQDADGAGDAAADTDAPASRPVADLGHAAFLDETHAPGSATASSGHRNVTLAFQSSNVIVTVRVEATGDGSVTPSGDTLQGDAERVARQLAGGLDG